MGSQRFSERAEEARRAQWRLNDLPWDERIRLAGDSRRERLLAKLDLLYLEAGRPHHRMSGMVGHG